MFLHPLFLIFLVRSYCFAPGTHQDLGMQEISRKNPFFTLLLMDTPVKKIDCRANMKAKNSLKEQNLLYL